MATFPSSSCVQLREIPRGDRVKTCACLMLQFKTFGFPEPFSQLGLEVICPLWAWAEVWSTACGVAGSGDHCVPGIQVQRGGMCVCRAGHHLSRAKPDLPILPHMHPKYFEPAVLPVSHMWFSVNTDFPDFSSNLCRCKGWCGWMSLLAQCSVWLLL